jgi:hypothetical protein
MESVLLGVIVGRVEKRRSLVLYILFQLDWS